MFDIRQLINEADDKLEKNDFAMARDLYRKAITIAEPTVSLLANLSIAEDQERLQFRRALGQQYPDSINARLCEAEALLSMNYASQAIDICNILLQNEGKDIKTKILIWLVRFRAASHIERYEMMVNDFIEIWSAAASLSSAKRFRPGLLKNLSAINKTEAVPALEALACKIILPQEIREFIMAKVDELKLLASVICSTSDSDHC